MPNFDDIYFSRDAWVHKGKFGKLLVVAGNYQYSGSPVFNGMSALKTGTDLVYIYTSERVANAVRAGNPDLIVIPYLDDYLKINYVDTLKDIIEKYKITAILIGGGLGNEEETYSTVLEIVQTFQLPTLLDATAIRAMKNSMVLLRQTKIAMTPNANEFFHLTGESVIENVDDRLIKVTSWAKKLETTILLKGYIDVVSNGSSTQQIIGGSPYMTKGGFGDCLAGVCAGLMARGISNYEALIAGSYIVKRAGELACKNLKESVLASDMFEYFSKAIDQMLIKSSQKV